MKLSDYFELLGLPVQFDLDPELIDERWKAVQKAVHPDRYAAGSEVERRVAMQWASAANEAARVLRDPLKRACYLLTRQGIDLQLETNTAMPAEFLMQQMSWREDLDEARRAGDEQAVARVQQSWADSVRQIRDQVAAELQAQRWDAAAAAVRRWFFLQRLANDFEPRRSAT